MAKKQVKQKKCPVGNEKEEFFNNITRYMPKKDHGKIIKFEGPFSNEIDEIFHETVRKTEQEIFDGMKILLVKLGYDIKVNEENYILAEGKIPIVLNAHVDTVFKDPPADMNVSEKSGIVFNMGKKNGIGADDRTGISIIIYLLLKGYRPHVLITRKEEKWGAGAQELVHDFKTPPFDIKYILCLDRHGENDCVFYDQRNPEFKKYIETFGFVTSSGSGADISFICPDWNVAGVNLSVGYENAHHYDEMQSLHVMRKICTRVGDMLDHVPDDNYTYKPSSFKVIVEMMDDFSHYHSNILDLYGVSEEYSAIITEAAEKIEAKFPFAVFDFRKSQMMVATDADDEMIVNLNKVELEKLAENIVKSDKSIGNMFLKNIDDILDVVKLYSHAMKLYHDAMEKLKLDNKKEMEEKWKDKVSKLKKVAGESVSFDYKEIRRIFKDNGIKNVFPTNEFLLSKDFSEDEMYDSIDPMGEICDLAWWCRFDFTKRRVYYVQNGNVAKFVFSEELAEYLRKILAAGSKGDGANFSEDVKTLSRIGFFEKIKSR